MPLLFQPVFLEYISSPDWHHPDLPYGRHEGMGIVGAAESGRRSRCPAPCSSWSGFFSRFSARWFMAWLARSPTAAFCEASAFACCCCFRVTPAQFAAESANRLGGQAAVTGGQPSSGVGGQARHPCHPVGRAHNASRAGVQVVVWSRRRATAITARPPMIHAAPLHTSCSMGTRRGYWAPPKQRPRLDDCHRRRSFSGDSVFADSSARMFLILWVLSRL